MLWNKLLAAALFTFAFIAPAQAGWVAVTVDISEQRMIVQSEDGHKEIYPVSTAGSGKRTPTGEFQPYLMRRMHYSSRYNNAPMPFSIFYSGNYAIHGTEHIKKLGRPASKGCVRLHPDHAERLFSMVKAVGMDNTYIRIVP
jgi:lipoprotein-anchoring transpeptidase ErfK/SrfK